MKLRIAVLLTLLFATISFVYAGNREARIAVFKQMLIDQETPEIRSSTWGVRDTGEDLDLGAGPGPVVEVTVPGKHRCVVAIHPSEDLTAMLGCEPLPAGERTIDS